MRILRTSRLRLSPVTTQNVTALWALLQQPDLRSFQDLPNVGLPAFTEMVAKRPKRLHPGASGRFEWLINATRSRKPIGWVSLRIAERDLQSGEIGYSLVRDSRGRGIATEAVRALLNEAFEEARLARLRAYCVPENAASRGVLDRLNFVSDGLLTHGATVSGHAVDVLVFCLEREAWRQSGNSIEMPASAYPA